jgi:uncharacterized protein (TIGR02145 family)
MKKIICAGVVLTAAACMVGCGDEVTNNVTERTGMSVVKEGDDIPDCKTDNEGEMIYISDSSATYFCADGKWQSLKGEDGAKGKNGSDGISCTVKENEKINGYDILCDGKKVGELKNGSQGEEGAKGKNGSDGKSCTVKENAKIDGYDVLCDGEKVGELKNGAKGDPGDDGVGTQGEPGEDGKSCTIASDEDGVVTLKCGDGEDAVTTTLYKAMCGVNPYDPEIMGCIDGEIVPKCGDVAYKPQKGVNTCVKDTLFEKCGANWFNTKSQVCVGGNVKGLCGTKQFNPLTSVCRSGSVESICGKYDVQLEAYTKKLVTLKIIKNEAGWSLTEAKALVEKPLPVTVFETDTMVKAQNLYVMLQDSGATASVIYTGADFDATTSFCHENTIYPLCDGKTYDPNSFICKDNELVTACGGQEYDTEVFTCTEDKKIKFKQAFTVTASKTSLSPDESALVEVAGFKGCTYNVEMVEDGILYTQFTSGDAENCSVSMKNPNMQAYTFEAAIGLNTVALGDKHYIMVEIPGASANPAPPLGPALGNLGVNIMNFCRTFNAATANDKGKMLSVVITVNSDKSFTYNTNYTGFPTVNITLESRCAGLALGSDEFCDGRDGQVYKQVKMGKKIWMAQNLNYETPDRTCPEGKVCAPESLVSSTCYGGEADSCAKYGRLYPWDVATGCDTTSTSCGSSSYVRGICPTGWHLPRKVELDSFIVAKTGEDEELADLIGLTVSNVWGAGAPYTYDADAFKDGKGNVLLDADGDKLGDWPNKFKPLPSGAASKSGSYGFSYWGAISGGDDTKFSGYWSSTAVSTAPFTANYMMIGSTGFKVDGAKTSDLVGLSVRCLKNAN